MKLTPVQERTLVELMGSREERPVFDRSLAGDLRADLEGRLRPVLPYVPEGEALWVTKARLTKLHAQCEGLFLADHLGEGEFELSWNLAVGSLVHKAVEVSVFARDLSEGELAESAMGRLRRDDGRFDEFVAGLDEGERGMLVAEVVNRVVLFRATFPPFEASWSPAVEPALKAFLCGERVVLSARPDLMLGAEDREEPMRARRLIIELKTGQERPEHDDDLRFYALVAALRLGVPPFRVATVLLEDGRWRAHDVAPEMLEAAVRRVGDGYARVAELLAGDSPALRPGPWCGWCPRRETCPESTYRSG